VRRADNLTTFMCRLSTNLGASASWNPKGLSRPIMGLLYLLPYKLDGRTLKIPRLPGQLSVYQRLNSIQSFNNSQVSANITMNSKAKDGIRDGKSKTFSSKTLSVV
jgi:hypothetical protein